MSAIQRSSGTKSGSKTSTTSDEVGTKKARVLKHKQREEEKEEESEEMEDSESELDQEEIDGNLGEKKERKPRRWRSGTKATMEIHREQKKTGTSFAKAPYARLVRGVAKSKSKQQSVRFTRGALQVLQLYGEDHIISDMSWANALGGKIGKRKTVMPRDLMMVRMMRPRGKPPSNWTPDEMQIFDEAY